METSGSVDNLQRLTASRNGRDSANLAFVQYTALTKAAPAVRDVIRVIAVLYDDVVQVIVCGDLEMPKDLRGKRIYLGKDGSGAKLAAEALLKAAGVAADQYIRVGADAGFGEAADLMIAGGGDVGLFMSGMPTPAVTEAAKAGNCRLVNVNITPEQLVRGNDAGIQWSISREDNSGKLLRRTENPDRNLGRTAGTCRSYRSR